MSTIQPPDAAPVATPPTDPDLPDGDLAGGAMTEEERERHEERRLLRRLRQRDERAFAGVVRTYQGRVFNVVFRMLGNREEAEDVAQDVFVTVFQSIDTFRGDAKLSTWLYRIAVNHCKNRLKYLRHRKKHLGRPLDEIAEAELARGSGGHIAGYHAHIPRPDELASGHQIEAIMQREIAALDEEHRVLVVLRDIQGLSYQEIGEITGLNIGTIKSRLHRARLALKEALERTM